MGELHLGDNVIHRMVGFHLDSSTGERGRMIVYPVYIIYSCGVPNQDKQPAASLPY